MKATLSRLYLTICRSIDVEEVEEPKGCDAAFDITFPDNEGTTGKMILVYEYNSFCQTVYTYKWSA